MPKPLGAHLLRGEMAAFAADGWTTIVSLLPMDQVMMADLEDEEALAAAEGVRFVHHQIMDFGVPTSDSFAPFIADLTTRLAAGESVAIHCWMGIGRASLAAAAILVTEGIDADDAWARISLARGKRVPETQRQIDFIADFATSAHPPET